ncbi:motility associated factor glycosyltransferase family protein [Paenibacillus sp. y28]|uniref:motility associated factor glycosyltransferase family protein n=1 Tax=Paenibacillus sp. y28 TaxID=3129110 RepID=UPI003016FC51
MCTILEENLVLLPVHLKNLLEPYTAGRIATTIEMMSSQEGSPVAIVHTGKQRVQTNSLVNPREEAERWAQTLNYSDTRVSFIYSCGFGYPLLEYAKRKKPYTETFVFEQSPELFYTMLCHVDLRPLLKDPFFHFIVGPMPQMKQQFDAMMNGDFLLRSTRLSAHFTWLAHRNLKQHYFALHQWLLGRLELMTSSVGNSIHDTLVGLYNILDNAEAIVRGPQLSGLRGAFAGKPAFIISSGPSLDRNIHHLAQACGKALLLTAESALRPCLKRNIYPDAVSVTERSPNVYHFHFAKDALPPELTLLGLTLIDPRIPQTVRGPWIPVFRSLEHSGKWIQEALTDDRSGLQGGSSSAHLAFEFALWVRANPIIFVGQDLAFGRDMHTHSSQSIYTEDYMASQVHALQNQQTWEVPGVDGKPVTTNKLWMGFKLWFEQQISQYPDTRFIDATEGGAYIEGTELMPLQEAVQAFCREPLETPLYHFVQQIMPSPEEIRLSEKVELLLKRSGEIRQSFLHMADMASEDIRSCRLVEKACLLREKYPETEIPAFIEALVHNNSSVYHKYTSVNLTTFVQHLIFAYQKKINDLGEIHSVERLRAMTSLQHQMLQHLRDTARTVAEHFEEVEARLRMRFKHTLVQ